MSIGQELQDLTTRMMQGGSTPTEIEQARKDHLQLQVDAAPASEIKGRGDDARAHAMFPSTKSTEPGYWVPLFDARPDILHALLGDLYQITKLHEQHRTGRRPRSVNGNLEELHAMLVPRFSQDSFADAVKELMGTQSLRAFAAKIPMHHHQLTRLMTGERAIVKVHDPRGSMLQLESIAKAGKVHPAFFREWRELYIWSVLQEVMAAKPNMSITMTKQLNRAREGR